jgi:hypothetical protein
MYAANFWVIEASRVLSRKWLYERWVAMVWSMGHKKPALSEGTELAKIRFPIMNP